MGQYLPFLFANLPPHIVDGIFRAVETSTEDRATLLRRYAAKFEEPGALPEEVWMLLGGDPAEAREPGDE
jgi:hypothetical protein